MNQRLGGQDPLDYISMYNNPGNAALNIPPHWHYVSFGLSDLHGDGRVHQQEILPDGEMRSGMGFELSFRLVKSDNASATDKTPARPPTWPASLLQALARYVFTTGNRLCAGDNIPWRKSLDSSASCIQHLLITTDPQLRRTLTPFGWVDFCQIVGVTEAELEQASRWNGNGVVNLLKKDPSTGGEFLITDMSRSQSVFELFPETLVQLERDLENEGSDLAGVNAEFTIHEVPKVSALNDCILGGFKKILLYFRPRLKWNRNLIWRLKSVQLLTMMSSSKLRKKNQPNVMLTPIRSRRCPTVDR